jgi:hypothetical protein
MNATSLHALVVDQHFGELTPEVAELLGEYLSENATARAEASRIREALTVTEETVRLHPEVAQLEVAESCLSARGKRDLSWLARAASIAALATLAGVGGFLAGQTHQPVSNAASNAAQDLPRPPRKDSPWARYRIASDFGSTGLQVVRVDAPNSVKGMLQ